MMRYDIHLPEDTRPAGTLPFAGTSPVTGETFGVTGRCFTRGGKPWFPVMGEFHFSRYPHALWEREILKMKAGGVDIIASYVFWIHHEEREGLFRWEDDRALARFLSLCEKHGMLFFLRIGPWAHGEARNGGFPDWLMAKGFELRSNDEGYLRCVARFFGEIAAQAQGHLLEDGGCVIGVQIENEYGHCGGFRGEKGRAHMRRLKQIAVEKGLVTPYYTATGWGGAVVVEGEMLPVLGAYADAPWDQGVEALPANVNFVFSRLRNDENIGSDQAMGEHDGFTYDTTRYPFATAELGGGIQVTGHRRPIVTALDTQAMIYAKLGSGSNLLGYYMYHGGTNPEGELTTLEESRASGGYSDLPVRSYDFQAVLGEYGEPHASYRYLKVLHMLLHDFGAQMAEAACHIPAESEQNPDNPDGLRFSVLRAPTMGLLCLNNHQRHRRMKDQLGIDMTVDGVRFPPFDLLRDESIMYPFRWTVEGVSIGFATAQPLCRIDTVGRSAIFFWCYSDAMTIQLDGETITLPQGARYQAPLPDDRALEIILLSRGQAENAWKVRRGGQQALLITEAAVINPADQVLLHGLREDVQVLTYTSGTEALFGRQTVHCAGTATNAAVPFTRVGENTYAFTLPDIPAEVDEAFLCIDFEGNAAKLYADGDLVADWFYTGLPWRVGLKKFAGRHMGTLTLALEPLRDDARVYLEKPPAYTNHVAASLHGVALDYRYTALLPDN